MTESSEAAMYRRALQLIAQAAKAGRYDLVGVTARRALLARDPQFDELERALASGGQRWDLDREL